jgi:hypothetical protein
MTLAAGRAQDWSAVDPLIRPYARYRTQAFALRAHRWRYGSAALREIRRIFLPSARAQDYLSLAPIRRLIREILNETPNAGGHPVAWRMDV